MLKYRLPRPATRGSFPPWLRVFLSAGALAVCWSAAGQPSSRPPAPAHVVLRLRTGAYDPLRAPSIANLAPAPAPGVPASSPGLYVVQFSGPIRPEWRRALEAAGAAVLEYLPDFAYLVRASASTAARFGSLPGHHWHGAFEGVRRAAGGAALAAHPPSVGTRRLRSQHGGPMLLDVMTLPGEDVRAVARRIPGRVVQRFARRRGFLRVSISPEAAARVAAVPGVEWIEPYVPPVLFNDVAAGLMQVPTARDEVGVYGRGQVVAVADTGLDVGSAAGISADFRGRIQRAYALSRSHGDWSDRNGHGTHVCGSVLGAGVLSGSDPANHLYAGSFAGMAPEASLVMQSIGASGGSLSLPADLSQLLLPPYQNDGARIHSDSWGSSDASQSGLYLLSTWQIDEICWQARDLTVVFAAGNGGVDADGDGVVDLSSLSPQATAKNVISVGSSESLRDMPVTWGIFPMFPSDPLWGSPLAAHPSGMAAFSSRGPTADGRIKPDVVAPGTWILSTRSHTSGAGSLWGAYSADYAYSGGTSMSAPLVAGATALVREGLQERFGLADPSSALVKAVLLNGADDLAPGQYGVGASREIPPRPNPVEGWGRVNVRQSLGLGGARSMLPVDEPAGLQTQEQRQYPLTVIPGDGPLRVTLAWTDPPSSLLAGPQLVNDLDLKLLAPDGHTLFGNGGSDRLNNVEAVELPQPAPGVYTVVVDGYNVPQGPQPFALVMSGPIQPLPATGLQVSLHTGSPALPLAGADLAVAGPPSLQLTSSAGGRIEARLPAGSYTLTPAKPGWTFDPPGRTVTLVEGQMLPVEFTASAAPGLLTGLLTGPDGLPIVGAAVAVSPGGLSAITGADGRYQFAALPPLVYSLTPSLPGTAFTPAARQVRVPIGGSARADFTVATATVSGTVLTVGSAEPQVVASAHPVRVTGAQSWTVSRPGAHWIRVHFSRIDLQPGVERLEVLDASGRPLNHWSGAFADIWSTWAAGSSVTIRHTASGAYARYGFQADVAQTDLGGKPLPDAAVALQPGGLATRTDGAGSFRFSGLSGASFNVAPALSGWEFFPPVAAVALPPGATAGTVSFLAQGPVWVSGQVVSRGTTQAVRFESLHPAANPGTGPAAAAAPASRTQEIAVPGATQLRLHFQRLAAETGVDFVRILGPQGGELQRYTGASADFWTDWLPASRVTVRLDSNNAGDDWGYLIDAVNSDLGAGGPIPGATVALSPGGASAMTGADGTFLVPALAPGSYTLTPASPGLFFAPPALAVTVPAAGLRGANFEATRTVPSAAPEVVAALTPDGQPAVRGLVWGAWTSMPQPAAGHLDQLLALQGVNDTPELIALAAGHLLHSRFLGGAWTAWLVLYGPATDRAPVAAAEPDGTLDLLAVGPDGAVLHSRFLNGVWQQQVVAAGVPAWEADRAALVAREDGTLELIGAGADRLPRHSRFLNGAWSTPGAMGSLTTALRPALAVGTDAPAASATLELVFVSGDGRVLHQRFRAGVWEMPRVLRSAGGPLIAYAPPALAAGPGARLELVVPTAGGLYHDRMQAGTWSGALRIDGIDARDVALAMLPPLDPPASLELFATAANGTLTYLYLHNGRWTAPTALGVLAASPAVPVMR